MPAIVIVGAQWGDEGKGKITDYLAPAANMVVRYQGGDNAGHTVVVGPSTYKFHLIPSGMLYRDKTCVLGNGVVIDPEELVGELDALEAQGVSTKGLRVSDQAHFILPTHRIIDQRSEAKKGDDKIGTTGRGIGPAYRDKVHREGIRLGDPSDPKRLRRLVAAHFASHESELTGIDWSVDRLVDYLVRMHARLAPYICNTPALLNDTLDNGGRVLLEGAQGTLLDIDHGTYPFVTSSSPTAGGACIGAGVGPTRINAIVGVAKAYTTRVGSGPFPTELHDAGGELLRKTGNEFGTTTGRPRRCGWLDLVALRYAVRINGITHLCITKLDVLDVFDELKLCSAYRVGGRETREFPTQLGALAEVEPIHETLRGWRQPTSGARSWSELPREAIAYISRIEDYLRVPVALVSVGAERTASFARLAIWESL
jgi:adenylosuccinate synthase